MKSQFHVNFQRKQVIIVAPACCLAGAQVLYFSQNLFQYDLKKQNLGPGQEACRGDVHSGCGGAAL